jgi:Na+/H+ antiporter NhaD/arsenite permease-like protein
LLVFHHFLLQVVDVHGGFKRLASWVVAEQRSTLAWGVGLLSFAMSAVLDNLTTTILMLSILARANPTDAELRKLLGAIVVIAANAGVCGFRGGSLPLCRCCSFSRFSRTSMAH